MTVWGPEERGRGAVFLLGLLLLLAGALQGALAWRLHGWGGQPDFVFAVTVSAALLSNVIAGGWIGLAGGLVTAALAGETVGSLLVSRTLAGFAAGWLAARLFRANPLVVMLGALLASAVAEIVYVLAAPRVGIRVWLGSALVGAIWNAALAVPCTFLLRRLGWETPDEAM